ncbi:hypothetical protein HID58_073487 [Brassica napus]|uniref:Uncharacterized protein n=1 Tax=Brassica napus TaxID=3708 RepID=A0ABQ7Z7D2_BRANA|nr:hypothetical protein HID58_073487 [Brassica napus]
MSYTKLKRTQSSLLRSSPTIHSLSSISECDVSDLEAGEKEEKQSRRKQSKPFGLINRTGSNRIKPGLVFTLSSFLLFFFVFSQTGTSENLLLCLAFVAVALFLASRNMAVINQTVTAIKQKHKPEPVQWYIGDSNQEPSNGDVYEGEFNGGRRCNGSGVYYYYVNGRYEGDWVNGRHDGYGIESWSKGSKFKGQYKQGLRHGYGVYWFYTGDSYSGEWFNGQSHGSGVQTCADGSSYVGEFKFGVKHGLGSYQFRNGDRYAGEYYGDKIHGFGVYHFANGQYYEGAWHEGRKQGYGTYGFRTGGVKCGEWDDGNLVNRHPLETGPVYKAVQVDFSFCLGKVTCCFDSKILNCLALQSAREMARKGVNQRRVDEQVMRAVAAANKAATAARVAAVKAVQNQMDAMVSLKL